MEYKPPEHLTIGVEHLRRNLPAIMSRVEAGTVIYTVTDYRRPVARLVPITEDFAGIPEAEQPFAGIPESEQPST